MPIRWIVPDTSPLPLGAYRGFVFNLEGRRLFPRLVQAMIWGNSRRYADLLGPGHAVMQAAGWREADGMPVCVSAMHGGRIAGVAWARRIILGNDELGCNLSFAVHPELEGRGVARLATAFAFELLYRERPRPVVANVQTREANHRAIALARSLGFHAPRLARVPAPLSGEAEGPPFITLRADAAALHCITEDLLMKRLGWNAAHAIREGMRA
ncbi:GNAT family N-acetyltransferase [Noviherbaspirillum galbum]|uniref:GNAT family N-acetyltransferase n=1 Tax=Noviherbaspirillum galbum TaxID=2709383 RepID=A0A6B3SSG8_9BURK|nr:GNAT family N-acetyltransferase [Noviherbaspirillum galbum]NEX63900.1 GNAT family N-acetyltransferase [Noviherbaspirillum galbum]